MVDLTATGLAVNYFSNPNSCQLWGFGCDSTQQSVVRDPWSKPGGQNGPTLPDQDTKPIRWADAQII